MYTDTDKAVQKALCEYFDDRTIVYFKAIVQPDEANDGYWHVRMQGLEGVLIVRVNGIGEIHCYGPVKGRCIA